MSYLALLRDTEGTDSELTKDLLTRATGKFYTPPPIGRQLVSSLWPLIERMDGHTLRVVDPFCGDGRLVAWLLTYVADQEKGKLFRWVVDLWDYDGAAVQVARETLSEIVRERGIDAEIRTNVGDTFAHALKFWGDFDVVITNPPWEVLKPDQREIGHLSQTESRAYIDGLREQDSFLAVHYPRSQPKRKFSGWGTNLARCGTELALRLIRQDGACGVVSPASLFADQVSEELRRWIFEDHRLTNVAYFPAEARLFQQVDQPTVTFTATLGDHAETNLSLTIYDRSGAEGARHAIAFAASTLRDTGFVLPILFGPGPLHLLPKLAHLPYFADLERDPEAGFWAGRELDETGHQKYIGKKGTHLFVKGRMIDRFEIREQPSLMVLPEARRIPRTADCLRIGWRDVSRPTQKRRMLATLIPPGWVTGNSLNVALFRDGDVLRTKALLGVMSSFVFEYQVRAYLATAHMSLGTVRKARIPRPTNGQIKDLAAIVERCLKGSAEAQTQVEIAVSKLYGLTREEFGAVLASFPKLSKKEVGELLTAKD